VHFARGQSSGHFQQAVRERGFAVIDVRNNAKIAYELWIHLGFVRQESPVTSRCAGPTVLPERFTAAQKPCRVNNEFATNRKMRHFETREGGVIGFEER
jgi:hypothetical protein